jgi:3-oxoacyl-[acyl-carrier protein] reductase
MDLGLQGKRCLVTGGTKGLGLASARALLQEGARIMVVSRSEENVARACELFSDRGDRFLARKADLNDASEIESACSAMEKAWGGIDILVGSSGGPPPSTAADLSQENARNALEGNFLSLVSLTQRVLPGMRERKWGRVVYVGTGGLLEPIPGLATSNSARSALASFAKTLASEVAAEGVTINMAIPGMIQTDRLMELFSGAAKKAGKSLEEITTEKLAAIPAGRLGNPDEFGAAVAFLCSEQAAYITGSAIRIDGGMIHSL